MSDERPAQKADESDEPTTDRPLPVIADTNPLQSQGWDLASGSMRIVEHECREGRFALYVPEVVLSELKAHGAVEARTAATRYTQDARTLQQLGELPGLADPVALTAAYPARLDRRVTEFAATVVPIPDVAHSQLLERALLKRKPFGEKKDTGYKDTLIWLTVLEVIREHGAPVAFITSDGDFRDGEDLAQDLRDDLASIGLSPDGVQLYRTFSDFIDANVPNVPDLQQRFEFRIRREPDFREMLIAHVVAAADEKGPALLEPLLVNIPLLQPRAVTYGSFQPVDDEPTVSRAAAASNEYDVFEVTIKGFLPVTLYIEAEPQAATPVVLPIVDNVEVEFAFNVTYEREAGGIVAAELDGVRSLATDLLARPKLPPTGLSGRFGRYRTALRDDS